MTKQNNVTAQEHFDTISPSPYYNEIQQLKEQIKGYDKTIDEIKIQGAEEIVMFFIRNNPRAAGKSFLIDLLNSYKASKAVNEHNN